MRRRLFRSALLAGSTALALAAPVVSTSTAALAGAEPEACAPGGGAGARGGHGADHRDISATEQKQIESRTKRVLAAKPAPGAAGTNSLASIPVYVHVMADKSGGGNVSDAAIRQQVAVLNATYAGADPDGPGLATGVGFTLAGIDRFYNSSWHTDKQSSTYRAQTRKGGKNALNIWLVDFKYLGIATFPWDYARQPSIDGIRVQYTSLPGGTAAGYDQGETATHEAGHWLGLYHTFQGGCTPPGDEVDDTPAEATPSYGCPTGKDTCTASGADPVHNYMDYSDDSCYFTFTAGQSKRIGQMWSAYRA